MSLCAVWSVSSGSGVSVLSFLSVFFSIIQSVFSSLTSQTHHRLALETRFEPFGMDLG